MTPALTLTPVERSRARSDLKYLRALYIVAVNHGQDPEDAAWDCTCKRTNRIGYHRIEAMTTIAFEPREVREVINHYADSGHDSRFAVLQSALMAWLTNPAVA